MNSFLLKPLLMVHFQIVPTSRVIKLKILNFRGNNYPAFRLVSLPQWLCLLTCPET